MLRPSISATTEQTVTVDVHLSASARLMAKARLEEDARLAAEISERESRRKRLKVEVEDIFVTDGQGAALVDGVSIDGHRVKLVCGSTTTIDQDALKRTFGLTQADLDSVSVVKENRPYLKLTAPRGGRPEE